MMRLAVLLAVVISSLSITPRAWAQGRLVRKTVPAAWQADHVQWIRDQNDDKIDDLIVPGPFFTNVIVNYKHCPTSEDIARLQTFGGIEAVSRYISSVYMFEVITDSIPSLVSDPEIAFVEKQIDFEVYLYFSVENIKVKEGDTYVDSTVEYFDSTLDGTGVTICVIDTGVDTDHPFFANTTVKGGYNAITDQFEDPTDDNGHGTAVASIALGQGAPPNYDYRGVAPGANLVDVKVADSGGRATCSVAMRALSTVYDKRFEWGVDIINMSFGTCYGVSDGLDSFSQLVDLAASMGIVVVTSVGNAGPNNSGLLTPAAATRAITVGWYGDNNTAIRSHHESET